MTIIADRGLFVRLLVKSGRFETPDAESFADAMDAATREPATKVDLLEVRNELKAELAALQRDMMLMEQRLDARIDAQGDKLMIKLAGTMVVVLGLFVAILRFLHI